MKLNEFIKKEIGVNIPRRYQTIGNIILIKLIPENDKGTCEKISEVIMKKIKRIKTVCFIEGVEGELRVPKIKYTFGDGTETIHKENGILYKLDVSKIMFSKGNLSERKRLLNEIGKNEIVLDMFAGIGYFSLGIAKHHPDVKIYSIEKNPTAFKYLNENIELNGIHNIISIMGDNRDENLMKNIPKVDRILMGYFPNTENFLPTALQYIKNGGVIHFHNTYREDELWKFAEDQVKGIINNYNFKPKIILEKKVKSFAPKIYHIVMDVKVWR